MRNRRDIIASILLILFGMAVSIESIRLKVGTFLLPEPGFYPFFVGLLLMGIAFVLLVQSCLGRGDASQQPHDAIGDLRRPMILLSSMGVYTALMNPIGYVLPTVLVAAVVLRIAGVTSWKVVGLISVGLSVGTYVLFSRILGIDLPAGVLSFIG